MAVTVIRIWLIILLIKAYIGLQYQFIGSLLGVSGWCIIVLRHALKIGYFLFSGTPLTTSKVRARIFGVSRNDSEIAYLRSCDAHTKTPGRCQAKSISEEVYPKKETAVWRNCQLFGVSVSSTSGVVDRFCDGLSMTPLGDVDVLIVARALHNYYLLDNEESFPVP